MGIKTAIEWCDSTCNLVMGCDGCELTPGHCYAERLVSRYVGKKGWPKDFFKPEFFKHRLEEALAWKDLTWTERPNKPWLNGMPRLIFLNDLGDCFSESIDDFTWLSEAVSATRLSPHVFMFLTKRPKRMAEFCEQWKREYCQPFPRNIWGGTTITGSNTMWRAADLANADLEVRLLSLEPLLSRVDLADTNMLTFCQYAGQVVVGECEHGLGCRERSILDYADWVIAGGETGPGARPSHHDWFRSLRDQCTAAGVPFFLKSMGGKIDTPNDLLIREIPNVK